MAAESTRDAIATAQKALDVGRPGLVDDATLSTLVSVSREATKDYNGWTNYPTWAVNLWLSNDEGLYNYAREIVASVKSDIESGRCGTITAAEVGTAVDTHVRLHVADALEDWVTNELTPDLGASFAADLLGYALDQVDWFEIADAWIEDVSAEADC